jgi:uncharacterized protein (TIGR02058 family)
MSRGLPSPGIFDRLAWRSRQGHNSIKAFLEAGGGVKVSEKRYIMQMGMGVDLHGQNPTEAAARAVHNAISNNCLCGMSEVLHTEHPEEKMHVSVLVACPRPDEVNTEEVLKNIPFGIKTIKVREGGMTSPNVFSPQLGDKTSDALIANASVTVSVDSED